MTPEHTKLLLECVTAYIELGWNVLPLCYPEDGKCTCGRDCEKPGKSPHYKLSPNGAKGATTDKAIIDAWFASGEKFNIGICAGEESGLVIVDVDPQHGGFDSLKKLIKKPIQTPKVITGSGGGHLYFKHPEGAVRNSAGTIAPGIDVRGTNGYVVAPPSIHVCGEPYKWKTDPRVELAEMPKWVVKKQRKPKADAVEGSIPEGKRDDELARIAGKLRRVGLEEENIYLHLAGIQCDPPMNDDDLRRIAHSVARYEPDPIAAGDAIMLTDGSPDTVANAYEDQSTYKHKYHPNDGWSMFKDGQYQQIDEEKQLSKYVSGYMAQCSFQGGKRVKRIPLHTGAIKDTIRQVSYLNTVYLRPKQEAPCWLTPENSAKRVIPLENGLLDWTELPFKLLEHTPDYYTRNYLPFKWNGDISSDLWDGFLADVTMNDTETMTLLQQWAGYCLLKHDHRQQKFMLIYGEAGTGKSVFANVLTHLIGISNVSTIPLELFSEPHMITQTYGKMLNTSDEAEECILDPSIENALKHYTGGTMFPFKELYKAPFSAYPTAKIMITTNHLPKFKDSSEGVWRRMELVGFNRVFAEHEQTKGLDNMIIKTEMPGVLAWALRGAISLLNEGYFIKPEASKIAMESYKNEMHPERVFLAENFEIAPNDMMYPQCKNVRRAYEMWAKENNFGVKNETNFGKSIRKIFANVTRVRMQQGAARTYFYSGIMVKVDSEYHTTIAGGA